MRIFSVATIALTIVAGGSCGPEPDQQLAPDFVLRLTEDFQAALDNLHAAADAGDEPFPGAIAAFALPDGQVVGVSTGWSDVEAQIPMEPDMRMPSGSIGKTYVAAVALSLSLDGVLDLDAPVARWIGDEAWFSRLPNGGALTMRHLLNHSGGLVDHAFDVPEFAAAIRDLARTGNADTSLAPRELIAFVLDREPLFPPGRGFNYTDTGYLVAGLVIERASRSTYYAELTRRILDPHGFRFTMPQDRREVPRLAQGYAFASADLFGTPVRVVEDGRMVFNPDIEWTGGGLFNNPQDLVRWFKILGDGEALPGTYLDDLLGSVAQEGIRDSANVYSLGIAIRTTPHGPAYGHGGFFPGYTSRVDYYPDHGVAVAMQINTDRSRVGEHLDALARVVIESLP